MAFFIFNSYDDIVILSRVSFNLNRKDCNAPLRFENERYINSSMIMLMIMIMDSSFYRGSL